MSDFTYETMRSPVRPSTLAERDDTPQPPLAALRHLDAAARATASAAAQATVGNAAIQRLVQREEMPEEEPEESTVQAKADAPVGPAGGPVAPEVEQRIDESRGQGSPLAGQLRDDMEGAFNTSFDGVRIHRDVEADELSHQLGAKAFTTGNDVFVRSDQASPGTESGNELLAHELAHVVQQRAMSGSGEMTVGPADDHHEAAADAAATQVVANRRVDDAAAEEADGDPTLAAVARQAEEEEIPEEEQA